jgi:aldehyde:ferredoxin oxidoreductase
MNGFELMKSKGYAGQILKIDLSSGRSSILPTADYADRFLGGRGVAAKIYWDNVPPKTGAGDPENCLIFITGPLAGFTRFSGCRWQICGKSPEMEPESFSYANLGGSWGAWLKYAGFDGLVITGKSPWPCFITIEDGTVAIREASRLWGKTAVETQVTLQEELGDQAKVVAIGPAGENQVSFATVLGAENASGSSGFGAVMGSKNMKAIVVVARQKKRPEAAEPKALSVLARQVQQLRIQNFEDYGHLLPLKTRLTSCYGCISGCTRGMYEAEDGHTYKHFCQAGMMYGGQAGKFPDERVKLGMLAARLCDQYGLDTGVMSPMIEWLGRCYSEGILNEEESGLPLSRIGSAEFIETLVKKISLREGFGEILAGGIIKAARGLGRGSGSLIGSSIMTRAGETRDHDPRLMLANALLLAMEPRKPVQLNHASALPLTRWVNWKAGRKDAFLSSEIFQRLAERYWGSPEAGDFSTCEGKSLAAKKIQDYGYIKESLILCDLAWPIYQVKNSEIRIGPYFLESRILSAITGVHFDEADLANVGERIFNLQRAILMREGWGGRKGDIILDYLHKEPLKMVFYDPECIVPGKDGAVASRRNAVIEETVFEKLKDEYYGLRGWDVESGYQTEKKLAELGLEDIAAGLAEINLLK